MSVKEVSFIIGNSPPRSFVMKKLSRILYSSFFLMTISVLTSHSSAQFFDGSSGNPGDWNDAANWDTDTLPLDDGATLTDIGAELGGLLDATASISGALTVDSIWELRIGRGNGATGVLNHSAGTLNINGWSFVGVDANDPMTPSMGTYNLTNNGILDGGETFFIGLGGGGGACSGFMTISDSASATFGAFVVGANDGNFGTVDQTGGAVEFNSWMTIGESSGATGIYNMSGGSLTQNVDYLTIGQQDGGNGTLNVSGDASVALNASGLSLGRLPGGMGKVELTGSNASFSTTDLLVGINDAFGGDPPFAFGDPTGEGTLSFVADGSGVTPIIASGDVYINDGSVMGSGNLEVDLSALGPGPSTDILLIEVGGTLTGTFNGLPQDADVGFGRTISYTFGDGNDIGLIAANSKCAFDLGDVNMDGKIDLLDVAPFVSSLTGGSYVCEADINQDGENDLLDVSPFVDLISGG